jgi:hypothetical protein
VNANVSDAGQAEAMVRFAVETFGGLHVLYNNAGILPKDDAGTWRRSGSRTRTVVVSTSWTGANRPGRYAARSAINAAATASTPPSPSLAPCPPTTSATRR